MHRWPLHEMIKLNHICLKRAETDCLVICDISITSVIKVDDKINKNLLIMKIQDELWIVSPWIYNDVCLDWRNLTLWNVLGQWKHQDLKLQMVFHLFYVIKLKIFKSMNQYVYQYQALLQVPGVTINLEVLILFYVQFPPKKELWAKIKENLLSISILVLLVLK
jgi:hypothetical protein